MQRETRKLLLDVLAAAQGIQQIATGVNFDHFLSNLQLRWSIERGFEIIGEAISQLRKIDATLVMRISDWKEIISFRNVLIHGYSEVRGDITWDIIQSELPTLVREVEQLIKESSDL